MDVPQTPCICCLPFVCADDPFQHSMHAHDPVVFTSIAPSTPCIGDLACGIRIPALQHFLHLQLAKKCKISSARAPDTVRSQSAKKVSCPHMGAPGARSLHLMCLQIDAARCSVGTATTAANGATRK
eukprot:1935799-Rhodomonas_salina.4